MHAVILALVALFDAAVSVTVRDGPFPTADVGDSIVVGVNANGEGTRVVRPVETALAEFDDETVDIPGIIYTSNGDGDIPAARLAALALFDACDDALKANPSLTGLLIAGGRARISDYELVPSTASGAEVLLTFTVQYDTRLT